MGYFTWTVANRRPIKTKSGEYAARCKLGYGGYGAIVCPDNTIIKESCYEGYGIFGGHDVYELVVDWNKDHLTEIPSIPGFKTWCDPDAFYAIMKAYQEDDKVALQAAIEAAQKKNNCVFREDWKRAVGIYIACQNNALLPYPIKIVNCVRPKPYSKLLPSVSTQ